MNIINNNSNSSFKMSLYEAFPFNYTVGGIPASEAFAVAIMAVGFYHRFAAVEQDILAVDAARLAQLKKLHLLIQEYDQDGLPITTNPSPTTTESLNRESSSVTITICNTNNNNNNNNNNNHNPSIAPSVDNGNTYQKKITHGERRVREFTEEQREIMDMIHLYEKQLEISIKRALLLKR